MGEASSYPAHREQRLLDFLRRLDSGGLVDRASLADAISETAPPGWAVDFADAPTLEEMAEALEFGEVID